jgi:hypothetical protein
MLRIDQIEVPLDQLQLPVEGVGGRTPNAGVQVGGRSITDPVIGERNHSAPARYAQEESIQSRLLHHIGQQTPL